MKFSLEQKTAIITGGARGIGKAIAQTFAAAGAHVHLLDLDETEGHNTVDEMKRNDLVTHFHKCDVSNNDEVRRACEQVLKTHPTIDILINNAGIGYVGNIERTSSEDMDRLYNINVKGVYHCIKAVIPNMKKSRSGVIINMASIASSVGIADRFAYSMTKGAVLTMTYSIAKDYLSHNIRCNCISPARVHTKFVDGFIEKNYPDRQEEMFEHLSKTQPIGRMGRPQEIANLALYLCSDEAAFVTGTDYPIDGGFIKLNNMVS